jgi:hypothetical protein
MSKIGPAINTSIPADVPVQQEPPFSPSDQICADNVLESLFDLFQSRRFQMTSGGINEIRHPRVISLLTDVPDEYRCMNTFHEIKAAGPEYVGEFYDFITEYLRMFI